MPPLQLLPLTPPLPLLPPLPLPAAPAAPAAAACCASLPPAWPACGPPLPSCSSLCPHRSLWSRRAPVPSLRGSCWAGRLHRLGSHAQGSVATMVACNAMCCVPLLPNSPHAMERLQGALSFTARFASPAPCPQINTPGTFTLLAIDPVGAGCNLCLPELVGLAVQGGCRTPLCGRLHAFHAPPAPHPASRPPPSAPLASRAPVPRALLGRAPCRTPPPPVRPSTAPVCTGW